MGVVHPNPAAESLLLTPRWVQCCDFTSLFYSTHQSGPTGKCNFHVCQRADVPLPINYLLNTFNWATWPACRGCSQKGMQINCSTIKSSLICKWNFGWNSVVEDKKNFDTCSCDMLCMHCRFNGVPHIRMFLKWAERTLTFSPLLRNSGSMTHWSQATPTSSLYADLTGQGQDVSYLKKHGRDSTMVLHVGSQTLSRRCVTMLGVVSISPSRVHPTLHRISRDAVPLLFEFLINSLTFPFLYI